MPVIMTEAELRELWQNGRDELPPFPPGTRFSPAARDFLRDHGITIQFSDDAAPLAFNPQHPLEVQPPVSKPLPKRERESLSKTILTEADIEDLLRQGTDTLVMDDQIVLTELARERALKGGLRLVREKSPSPTSAAPRSHNIPLLPAAPALKPLAEAPVSKRFFTDQDIVELHQQGITRLELTDQTVLTELAREKALRLGIELVKVSQPSGADEGLVAQVKAAVLTRLGGAEVDERVLDTIIRKVLAGLK